MWPWLAGWAIGVALQWQQPQLWPVAAYGVVLCVAVVAAWAWRVAPAHTIRMGVSVIADSTLAQNRSIVLPLRQASDAAALVLTDGLGDADFLQILQGAVPDLVEARQQVQEHARLPARPLLAAHQPAHQP